MTIHEEFNKVQTEALAITDKAKAENRGMTEDEKKSVEEKFARLNQLKELIDTEKKLAAIEIDEVDEVKAEATKSFKKTEHTDVVKDAANKVIDELNYFAKTGDKSKFALTSSTGTGALMPKNIPGWYNTRSSKNAIREAFSVIGKPVMVSDSTDDWKVPAMVDTISANSDQEGATTGASSDAGVQELDLSLDEYHSKAQWLSKKVINAQGFDVVSFIGPEAKARIERAEDATWVDALESSATLGKATASPTAIVYNDLVDFDESLGAGYDQTSQFYIVSPTARTAIRKIADNNVRPIFSTEAGLDRLFGKPLFVSSNLATVASGNVVGLLVSAEGAFLRDTTSNELVRYENDYNHPGQVGFEAIGYSAFACASGCVRSLRMN